jgi:cytochrome c oxidase cbb3-type subunit 3
MSRRKFIFGAAAWLLGLVLMPRAHGEEDAGGLAPFLLVRTNKSMRQALIDLNQAIVDNNYVFIREQSADSRLTRPADENRNVVFVYFCNFSMLDHALKVDERVGVFLPCRVTLLQRPQGVDLIAVNPKLIGRQLDDARLNDICDQLTQDYRNILDEASL